MTSHEERVTEKLIEFYSDSLRDYSNVIIPRYLARIEELEAQVAELKGKLND